MSVKLLKKLDRWRHCFSYSQTDIAEMLELRQATVSKLLNGDRDILWKHLAKLHDETGVDLNYLADDTMTEEPTREYMGKLAEVQRAVKMLGVDEVLRRVSDQPPQQFYQPYAPAPQYQPVPPPVSVYSPRHPAPPQPVDPQHFNVQSPRGFEPTRPGPTNWMDAANGTTGGSLDEPTRRRRKPPGTGGKP